MADGLKTYLNDFFNILKVYEDEARGHDFKAYIHQSILQFLDNENKDTAFAVYLNFFDAYKISLGEDGNQFLDLLDMMRSYEESASTLTAKQRDHYVHSVNVFLLGLAVYGANKRFRQFFSGSVLDNESYPWAYETEHEEFFYRWGIAALFHDVGYPIEIISKQANQYLNFLTEAVREDLRSSDEQKKEDHQIRAFLDYEDFSQLNRLPDAGNLVAFCSCFINKPETVVNQLTVTPIDLLAHSISTDFDLDFVAVQQRLEGFVSDMQKYGFVDHGFYSAIIVLQWHAFLMQKADWNAEYFFTPLADCATAILLHNYYGNVLQNPPFNLGPLDPATSPLSYLLILCDELQEWNREAYGYEDKRRVSADRSDVTVTNDFFRTVYISDSSLLGDEFERKKEALLMKRLNLTAVFPEGFEIDSVNAESALWRIQKSSDTSTPIARPLFDQLENIAKEIHARYLADQQDAQKGETPELRDWEELPEDIKYSNLAQARHIADKLRLIGCGIAPKGTVCALSSLTKDEIEYLSIIEHDRWMDERISSGWTFGKKKDSDRKITPYLVPWDDLTEDVKDLDRNVVRNIIPLLDKVGLAAYRIEQSKKSDTE